MNYISGTAKPIIGEQLQVKINCYEITVQCDANDGDYMTDTWTQSDIDEIECLLINYLGRYSGKWCKGWNG